jgi:arylsulfatase A-like enzyme
MEIPRRAGVAVPLAALILAGAVLAANAIGLFDENEPLPSFEAQACSLPGDWLLRTQRGYYQPRSGQVSLLPRYPAYMASGGGGWSHSGPWPYLQKVPIVFYGPGIIDPTGDVDRPVTTADIAPTIMTMLKGFFRTEDGDSLDEVARISGTLLRKPAPRLILTIVWDGGGWNVLEQWPDAWPNLARMMREGVTYTGATVGSSPSVTPAVHTTLGTGVFPWTHGITGVPVRDENGEVVDAFLKGESARFLRVSALAERWDEQHLNRVHVAMVGYEPWHLGMIGAGAERDNGDKDDAVWLDIETNEWITNPEHYRLPDAFENAQGLEQDLRVTDAADGEVDRAWRDNAILDSPDRVEEVPGFIDYHTRAMLKMIKDEGYGRDKVTDLVFTNYKQIDRNGHYYNMASDEVLDSLTESDKVLADIEEVLNREVGEGKWVVIMTADHGQQPDAPAIDAYGIDPKEVQRDIDDEFGPITRAVWPTEVFLLEDEMEKLDVTEEDVANFLGDYRLDENTEGAAATETTGRFGPQDRIFDMAIPSRLLPTLRCNAGRK